MLYCNNILKVLHSRRSSGIYLILPVDMHHVPYQITGLHTQKAYTHTGTSSSQCVHQTLYHLLMHIHISFCIYAIRPVCAHHGVRIGCLIAIFRQNAYMHEQITKEFVGRRYLYECTPFGYVNLWICAGGVT